MISTGGPQRGGEDSHALIIADAKVSSVIDAEAKGKFIYNSPLPLRSAAAKLGEEQNDALLPQPWVTGELTDSAVRAASPPLSTLLFLHSLLSSFSSIFSVVLVCLVIILSSIISIIPWCSSGPSTTAACIQKKETKPEQCPLPPSSSGNAINFSLSAGEGECASVCV